MSNSASQSRWLSLLQVLALLALTSRTLVPLGHGPCAAGGDAGGGAGVTSAGEPQHDHDPDTCPICKALRDSWSPAIEASPCHLEDAAARPAFRPLVVRFAHRLDLSAAVARAPPSC